MKSMFVLLAFVIIISEVSPQDGGGEKTGSTTTKDSLDKSENEIKADYEKAIGELTASRAAYNKIKAKYDEELKNENETYTAIVKLDQRLTVMEKAYDKELARYKELSNNYNKSMDALETLANELKQARSHYIDVRAKNDEAIRNYQILMGKSDKGKEKGSGGAEDKE